VTKFALPVLVLCILALFSVSVTSQSNDVPPDLGALRAELTQKIADVDKAKQDREQQLIKSIDSIRAEVQRLSDEAKANSDKITQTVMLRSDLLKLIQDSKSSSDKATQLMLEQIDALRSDQVKLLKEAKETSDKAAQGLRQEVTAAQAKLMAQVGDTLKTNTARSEAVSQRVEAMKKDLDDVKKNVEEEQQNGSNISPGFALFIALAALVIGPFAAYQITANQLAAAKRQAAETTATPQPQAAQTAQPAQSEDAAETAEVEPPLAPPAAAEQPQEGFPHHHHDTAPPGEQASADHDISGHQGAEPDPEKV